MGNEMGPNENTLSKIQGWKLFFIFLGSGWLIERLGLQSLAIRYSATWVDAQNHWRIEYWVLFCRRLESEEPRNTACELQYFEINLVLIFDLTSNKPNIFILLTTVWIYHKEICIIILIFSSSKSNPTKYI